MTKEKKDAIKNIVEKNRLIKNSLIFFVLCNYDKEEDLVSIEVVPIEKSLQKVFVGNVVALEDLTNGVVFKEIIDIASNENDACARLGTRLIRYHQQRNEKTIARVFSTPKYFAKYVDSCADNNKENICVPEKLKECLIKHPMEKVCFNKKQTLEVAKQSESIIFEALTGRGPVKNKTKTL